DETAKYPVKHTDFMTDDEDKNLQTVSDLEEGLYRKRLISYGGLLKEIHKELNLDDAEDGDLVHTDDDDKATYDGYSIVDEWNWERKNYFIKYNCSTNGPYCCISDEILNLKLRLYVVKCFNQV